MELNIVFYSITLIAIMIAVGAILAKSFPFNDDTRKVFISIIVNIAMPCIILSSIFAVEMNNETFKKIMLVFLISILINMLGIGIGWLMAIVFHRKSKRVREIAILSGLGNTGFIGIPLCALLFGPEGALYAAIFDAGVDFTIWTVGVLMLKKSNLSIMESFKMMINIPNIAIVFGLSMSYFQWQLPTMLVDLTNKFAALASPLAMFYIGILIMTLKQSQIKTIGNKVWLPISIKLIILPVLAAAILFTIGLENLILQTILIQTMMPTLTLASILFAKYSADEEFGAFTTVLSTILAILTIPFMVFVLNHLVPS